MKRRKLLQKALTKPAALKFTEICRLAEAYGYKLDRISGSHHIYEHPRTNRPLNFQKVRGMAKAYQVRQLLRDVEEFNLIFEE
jgi:predicted RNA binding protein YcfA (HicA-like mRNA interferase family)